MRAQLIEVDPNRSRCSTHSPPLSRQNTILILHVQALCLPQIRQDIDHLRQRNVFGKARRHERYLDSAPSPPAGIEEDIDDSVNVDRDRMSFFF
mmetsp:Transcript_8489/g.17625  ORF Transcript_8489/g.17625 Transcript_8489/m.17625 type:complete len:94 (-) Transcript_8489:563-844(-)